MKNTVISQWKQLLVSAALLLPIYSANASSFGQNLPEVTPEPCSNEQQDLLDKLKYAFSTTLSSNCSAESADIPRFGLHLKSRPNLATPEPQEGEGRRTPTFELKVPF